MAWTADVFGAETAALAELVDLAGLRVLEVGAGDGRLTRRYASQAGEVVGIEPDPELVADARAALPAELADRVRFEETDVVELDVPPGRFDLVLLSWSL